MEFGRARCRTHYEREPKKRDIIRPKSGRPRKEEVEKECLVQRKQGREMRVSYCMLQEPKLCARRVCQGHKGQKETQCRLQKKQGIKRKPCTLRCKGSRKYLPRVQKTLRGQEKPGNTNTTSSRNTVASRVSDLHEEEAGGTGCWKLKKKQKVPRRTMPQFDGGRFDQNRKSS